MVEGGVAPHPARELLARIKTERERRDRRTEHVASDRHQAVGHHDRPKGRPKKNNDGGHRENAEREDDDAALGAGLVDRPADRRLDEKPEQAAHCRHQANFRLAPMLLRNEEDVEIGADGAANVGGEEIQCVEGEGVEAVRAGASVRRASTCHGGMFYRRRGFHRGAAAGRPFHSSTFYDRAIAVPAGHSDWPIVCGPSLNNKPSIESPRLIP